MANAPLPKFRKPPVTEVVCGIYFQELPALQVAHVGRLWDRLKSEYPRTETMPPLPPVMEQHGTSEIAVHFQVSSAEIGQFPRVWFVNMDGSILVQVQRDRLILNWRQIAPESMAYPSYDVLAAKLTTLHAEFRAFLKDERLGDLELLGLELAYVNMFLVGREIGSFADMRSLVPFLSAPTIEDASVPGVLTGMNWNAQFDIPNGEGNFYLSLGTIQRRSDGQGAVRFDLLARKFSPSVSPDGMQQWFDLAHETIVTTFAGVTNPEIQRRVWERSQ